MTKIIIGLLSCEQHHDRDELCRNTWIPHATAIGIDVVFLRGGSTSGRAERRGDILLLPTPTDYKTLPQRTRAFCQWFLTTDAEICVKADDDSLLIPDRLLNYEQLGSDYFGNEPGKRWRGYCSGAGYGLSRRAAEIVATHMTVRAGPEDMHVGRVLAEHKIKPVMPSPRRFISWGADEPSRRPTLNNQVIITHQIPVDLWHKICQEFWQNG